MRLHETLQRRICRTGFCLLCVLPTAGVLGYSTSRKMPSHTRRCERELCERLGLAVKLRAASYPKPALTRYEGLELADPETGETGLRCAWLELESVDGRVVISAGQGEIETGRLPQLWQLLLRRLRHELPGAAELRLTPCQLTLHGPDGSQTYDDVRGGIEPTDQGETIEIRFRIAGADTAEEASLRLVRDRSNLVPNTRLELDTGGGDLPVSIFAPLADVTGWLGGGSSFRGVLWVDQAADGWNAEMAGRLRGVDLQTLVADHFPHQLDGEAEIEIGKAIVHRGRLIEANGSLAAGPGTMGTSLIDAAVDVLGCEGDGLGQDVNAVAFDELAFRFRIGAGGLTLAGTCRRARLRGAVLVDTEGRILLGQAPQGTVGPVIGLVRLLVPQSKVQVPATRETSALVGLLPIPPIVAPIRDDALPRAGAVRIGPKRVGEK
jgi:hypothetical protein